MAVHPLYSAWAKFNWATSHMGSVADAIQRSVDPETHPIAVDINLEPSHGNTAVVRISKLPDIQTDYCLALGDTIQNFHAALDHLAWTLVKMGHNPRPARPQNVYFPLARSGANFRSQINRWLPGVPTEFRPLIRRYQPYRTGEGQKALRWLRELSNADKHRILIPAVVSLGPINLTVVTNWPIQGIDRLVKGQRALKVGTPLLRVPLIPVLGTHCQLQVQGNLACFPSLGYGVPVGEALPLIRDTVFEVLEHV
jgi:hypothetical protein